MRVYILTPKKWDEERQRYESDIYAQGYEETYADAKRAAKQLLNMYGYDRVNIEMCNVKRSYFATQKEYVEACNNDVNEYLEWIESWSKYGRTPVVVVDGKPIMRWDMKA